MPTGVSDGACRRECPTALADGSVRRRLPTGVSDGNVRRECPTGRCRRECPTVDADGRRRMVRKRPTHARTTQGRGNSPLGQGALNRNAKIRSIFFARKSILTNVRNKNPILNIGAFRESRISRNRTGTKRSKSPNFRFAQRPTRALRSVGGDGACRRGVSDGACRTSMPIGTLGSI